MGLGMPMSPSRFPLLFLGITAEAVCAAACRGKVLRVKGEVMVYCCKLVITGVRVLPGSGVFNCTAAFRVGFTCVNILLKIHLRTERYTRILG